MKIRWVLLFLCITFALPAGVGAQTGEPAVQESSSTADVSKQLINPVADIWALNFQLNRYYLQGDATDRTREQDVMNFQPVLPIHLTKEWNLINRPVFPYLFSSPDFEPGDGWDEKSGLGDIALVSLLSPANKVYRLGGLHGGASGRLRAALGRPLSGDTGVAGFDQGHVVLRLK